MTVTTAEAATTDADTERKRAATAQARLALVGVVLRRIEADDGRPQWIVTEDALCRSFDSLGELERWIDLRTRRRVGAVA